jgi:hypothetical protein
MNYEWERLLGVVFFMPRPEGRGYNRYNPSEDDFLAANPLIEGFVAVPVSREENNKRQPRRDGFATSYRSTN